MNIDHKITIEEVNLVLKSIERQCQVEPYEACELKPSRKINQVSNWGLLLAMALSGAVVISILYLFMRFA